MQQYPICGHCRDAVEDPVFAAACGHDECPSLVWHPICLMEYREQFDAQRERWTEAAWESLQRNHQAMLMLLIQRLNSEGEFFFPGGQS